MLQITNIKLPRFIGTGQCQLLCFSDASGKAYATNIYLRCVQGTSVTTNLIFSKAGVAPNKSITLPRLELLAV